MSLVIDLSGRAALVTGGSRGIGRATCLALAGAGADVLVAAAAGSEGFRGTVDAIRRLGRRSEGVLGDLQSPRTAADYVQAARNAFGRLDILVNNAGIWEASPIDALAPEGLERTLAVNLASAFHLCREALPLLSASPAGRIVNISSTASLLGEPSYSAYAASKAGLDALTRSLAVELGPRGVTVNSVAPGWTLTEMTDSELSSPEGKQLLAEIPLRKIAEPADVAHAVLYLASDLAGHVTGITLPVEGGYCIRR